MLSEIISLITISYFAIGCNKSNEDVQNVLNEESISRGGGEQFFFSNNWEKEELNVTDENFEEEVLKSNMIVLVDFWVGWCGSCKKLDPIIKELTEDYKDEVKIVKIEADKNQFTFDQYSQYSKGNVPLLLLFINGEVVDKRLGLASKQEIVEMFDKYIEE